MTRPRRVTDRVKATSGLTMPPKRRWRKGPAGRRERGGPNRNSRPMRTSASAELAAAMIAAWCRGRGSRSSATGHDQTASSRSRRRGRSGTRGIAQEADVGQAGDASEDPGSLIRMEGDRDQQRHEGETVRSEDEREEIRAPAIPIRASTRVMGPTPPPPVACQLLEPP